MEANVKKYIDQLILQSRNIVEINDSYMDQLLIIREQQIEAGIKFLKG